MKILQMPTSWHIGLILIVGVFGISATAVLVRLSLAAANVQGVGFSLLISAVRLSISAFLLVPAWYNLKSSSPSLKSIYYALAAGICLALHFATWITSLSFISIAASSTLVSTTPIWVALLSWLWFREKLSVVGLSGIGIACLGAVLIASGGFDDATVQSNASLGNSLALAGSWMYSLYLLLGHKAQQEGLGLGGYVAIAYSTGAILLIPLPILFGTPYTGYPPVVYLYMLLIAILSQVIGHTSLNWAINQISPTLVTLATLFEPVGASILGYVFLNEIPGLLTLIGAVVLLMGVACVIVGTTKAVSRQ